MAHKLPPLMLLLFISYGVSSKTAVQYRDYKITAITVRDIQRTSAPGLYIFQKDLNNRLYIVSEHKNILGWRINKGDILLITNPQVEVILSNGLETIRLVKNPRNRGLWTSPVKTASLFYNSDSFFKDYGYKKIAVLDENPALFSGSGTYQQELSLARQVESLYGRQRYSDDELKLVLRLAVLLKNTGGLEEARVLLENFLPGARTGKNKKTAGSFFSQLGDVYSILGYINRTLFYYKQSIDRRFALYQDKPYEKEYALDLIIGYLKLGDAYYSTGDKNNGLIYYRKALNINKKIALLHYDDKLKELLSYNYVRMGDVLLFKDTISVREEAENRNTALQYYRESLAITREKYNASRTFANLFQVLYLYDRMFTFYSITRNPSAESILEKKIQIAEFARKESDVYNYYLIRKQMESYIQLLRYYDSQAIPLALKDEDIIFLEKAASGSGGEEVKEHYIFDNEKRVYTLKPRLDEKTLERLAAIFKTSQFINEKKGLPL